MKTYHVEDFDAYPGCDADAGPGIRAAVQAAISAGETAEVVLGPGQYHLWPAKARGYCIDLCNARELTFRGSGIDTELILHDPLSSAFRLSRCHDMILKDLAVDHDPVPFTQGTVQEVDQEHGSFDLELDEGFPPFDVPHLAELSSRLGMFFERTMRRIKAGTLDHFFFTVERLDDRRWRASTTPSALESVVAGDRFVHRGTGSDGIDVFSCRRCLIENITMYAAGGLDMAVCGCTETTIRAFRVMPRPGTKRLITSNADGIHCCGNPHGPIIEDCYFEGMMDDGININTHANTIIAVLSETEIIVTGGSGIDAGQRLQVFDLPHGRLRAEVQALSVQRDGQEQRIVLDRAVAEMQPGEKGKQNGDILYNLDTAGEGYIIRRNHMFRHRRYAILLRPGKGLVEDNLIEEVSGAGVVLENDPYWGEGPVPQDIIVRNNTIRDVGYCRGYADNHHGAIQVKGRKAGDILAEGQIIRDIVIENNHLRDLTGTGIYVGAADGVLLRNNALLPAAGVTLTPEEAVVMENSVHVEIVNSNVRGGG